MRPLRGFGIAPTTSIRASGKGWPFAFPRRAATAFAVSGRTRIARAVRWCFASRSRIAATWASVFPGEYTASGNPRRIARCVSTFAKPRSSKGNERRDSIASPTEALPAFRLRRIFSRRLRSTDGAGLEDEIKLSGALTLLCHMVGLVHPRPIAVEPMREVIKHRLQRTRLFCEMRPAQFPSERGDDAIDNFLPLPEIP